MHAAGLRAPGARAGPGPHAALEAARRDVGRRVPGQRYLPEALVNYLALIGWSPGDDAELHAVDELARRFSLDAVGLSAGVFDEEKLAWVNRHYLKAAASERLARALGAVLSPRPACRCARRSRPGVSRLRAADCVARRSIGSTRCRRGCRSCSTTRPSGRSPIQPCGRRCAARAAGGGGGAGRGARDGAPARPRAVPGGRERGEDADGPEREGALPSDSCRADRPGRRAGARPGRTGDRSRRRPAGERGPSEDSGTRERAAAFARALAVL